MPVVPAWPVSREERERGIATFLGVLVPHLMGGIGDDSPLRLRQQTFETSIDQVSELETALAA
jgi:hypothetical protein